MQPNGYENPFFQENIKKAEKYGVKIIEPLFSEGKAKIASTRKIVKEVRKYFLIYQWETINTL